jgi:glycosyltransferase involved in cell wall biosynthesis
MKNVCFFDSIKFWGGGEKLHLEYAIEFRKKNYKVIIIAKAHSSLSEKAISKGLEVFHLTVRNISFLNLFKIFELVYFYKKHKIDTVIFSTSQDLKLGSFAAKFAGVKRIVYLRGLAAPIKSNFINNLLFKYILTHIISNSEATKSCILQNIGKYINHDKVKTIYHGIYTAESKINNHICTEIALKGKGVILGNAGRLTHQKGQKYLIDIAVKLKEQKIDFTIFIAGSGELQGELEQLIEKHSLQNEVILLGFVEDMDSFMNSIDIFLLTSIWEGFGYVLVEAMIKSKPIVAFDISSNPEIIANNETGFLIKYPNLELFTQKTQFLIQNVEVRKQMGENGYESVLRRFNLKDRITEFEYYLLGK